MRETIYTIISLLVIMIGKGKFERTDDTEGILIAVGMVHPNGDNTENRRTDDQGRRASHDTPST